jgi:hypothetical protein
MNSNKDKYNNNNNNNNINNNNNQVYMNRIIQIYKTNKARIFQNKIPHANKVVYKNKIR